MIKTEKMQEKVVLVGVETFDNHQTFEASMTELASLAATAGAVLPAPVPMPTKATDSILDSPA